MKHVWCVLDDEGLLTEIHEDKDKAIDAAARMLSLSDEADLEIEDKVSIVDVWERNHPRNGFIVERWGVVPE